MVAAAHSGIRNTRAQSLPWQCWTSRAHRRATKAEASFFATRIACPGSNPLRSRTSVPTPRRSACPCPGPACPAQPASPACLGAAINTHALKVRNVQNIQALGSYYPQQITTVVLLISILFKLTMFITFLRNCHSKVNKT